MKRRCTDLASDQKLETGLLGRQVCSWGHGLSYSNRTLPLGLGSEAEPSSRVRLVPLGPCWEGCIRPGAGLMLLEESGFPAYGRSGREDRQCSQKEMEDEGGQQSHRGGNRRAVESEVLSPAGPFSSLHPYVGAGWASRSLVLRRGR